LQAYLTFNPVVNVAKLLKYNGTDVAVNNSSLLLDIQIQITQTLQILTINIYSESIYKRY